MMIMYLKFQDDMLEQDVRVSQGRPKRHNQYVQSVMLRDSDNTKLIQFIWLPHFAFTSYRYTNELMTKIHNLKNLQGSCFNPVYRENIFQLGCAWQPDNHILTWQTYTTSQYYKGNVWHTTHTHIAFQP